MTNPLINVSDAEKQAKQTRIHFMAAAIAISHGVDEDIFITSDDEWNRAIAHATMIHELLESKNLIVHLGGNPKQWHECVECGARFDTRNAAVLCHRMHPKPERAA